MPCPCGIVLQRYFPSWDATRKDQVLESLFKQQVEARIKKETNITRVSQPCAAMHLSMDGWMDCAGKGHAHVLDTE